MSKGFYILEYADYPDRPIQLTCRTTVGLERKSVDASKFIIETCDDHCDCTSWVDGGETLLTHEQAIDATANSEWNED